MDLLLNKTNIFRNFETKSKGQINVLHFVLCNAFLECYDPRFLNKTDMTIQKYNHQGVIHTLPTVKTGDMSTDQTIRTKHSLLASTRRYSKVSLLLIPFAEAFTSVVQIYRFLSKSIQILLCKSKCNTFTPAGNYMFKVNNRNIRTRTIETLEPLASFWCLYC